MLTPTAANQPRNFDETSITGGSAVPCVCVAVEKLGQILTDGGEDFGRIHQEQHS